jgi:hypothetical protein
MSVVISACSLSRRSETYQALAPISVLYTVLCLFYI